MALEVEMIEVLNFHKFPEKFTIIQTFHFTLCSGKHIESKS